MQSKSIKLVKEMNMLLCVTILLYCQISHVGAANAMYVAELMIEGNSTLDVSSILPNLLGLNLDVATIENATIIAQCEIIGEETTCWCMNDYIWSNLVCNTAKCCNNSNCVANISDYTPLCVPKVFVSINGIAAKSLTPYQTILEAQFKLMNGFSSLTLSDTSFRVNLNSTFTTDTLQNILSTLQNTHNLNITVITQGMVTIELPKDKVCYNSSYVLNCSMEETFKTCMWNISQDQQAPQTIGDGTEVRMGSCTNRTSINLTKITSLWAGNYTCMFTAKAVTHAATAELKVALLPEVINLTSVPPTIDCTGVTKVAINVTCSFTKSSEQYTVTINGTITDNNVVQQFPVNCGNQKSTTVVCKITNSVNQSRDVSLTIPIILPGESFCDTKIENYTETWPKTKDQEKATILCTEPGRTGTKERKCSNKVFLEIINLCVKAALNELNNKAENFLRGTGATAEVATEIFDNLKNNTGTGNTYGDVTATVNILSTMNRASKTIKLSESVLPSFIESASNMLNTSWNSGGNKKDFILATSYLSSVEGLVNNIEMNNSEGHNASNVQLAVCRNAVVCNRTIFNVEVELNSSASVVKTVGLQNLTDRLLSFSNFTVTPVNLVVTAVAENRTGPVNIRLAFPTLDFSSPYHCVFWNFTENEGEGSWSKHGCNWTKVSENISYCECDHLTSFAMLMSKTPVTDKPLEKITYIALGISICSLIVFILIECLVWNAVVKTNLSHFRHTALVNISLCLLLADCSFVAASFPKMLTDTLCLILAVAMHFFYLAMFFWMLCLSLMLLHQLIFVFHPLRKKVYMILSIIIGYAFPSVTVGATYIYYSKQTDITYYDRNTCWLTYKSFMKGSMFAFVFPVGTIVFVNMFSMVVVIVTLLRPAAAENNKKDDKEAAKSIIKAIIFLTPVFGGTWILGLVLFQTEDNSTVRPLILYTFTIVNALQGFFILVTGCFGEKRVRDEIVKLVISSKKEKSESKKNLTSSYGKN